MTKVRLSISETTELIERALTSAGFANDESTSIAAHLIDCELRGLDYGGLARAVSIVERVGAPEYQHKDIEITRTSNVVASIDGGNRPGYLVAQKAVDLGIEMALSNGVAAIGAFNTWYSGMLSYYLEQITAKGLIGIMSAAGPARVAPHGGSQAAFGTNPLAMGVPTAGNPVILDLGTSSIMYGEVVLAKRLGRDLPEGTAFNADGQRTVDPTEALLGAFAPWGGHKGSGLAMFMHLLGLAAGHGLEEEQYNPDASFMLLIIDPRKFYGGDTYRKRASEFADMVRNSSPITTDSPIRMPFDRSIAQRDAARQTNEILVEQRIIDLLSKTTSPY